jgi:hypothetical protein
MMRTHYSFAGRGDVEEKIVCSWFMIVGRKGVIEDNRGRGCYTVRVALRRKKGRSGRRVAKFRVYFFNFSSTGSKANRPERTPEASK